MIPKISIIVPVYKVEKYIDQCLQSLVNQTLKDIEIILVNDGSPDNSLSICERYAAQDRRIQVYTKANGGLSDARNYGLARATAPYIGFVDSDDYIDTNMYEYLYGLIEKYNADISVCAVQRFDENGSLGEKRCIPAETLTNKREAMCELIEGTRIMNAVWNKLYKAELLNGIEFIKGKLYEDEFFSYKVFDRAEHVAMGNEVCYYYRKNNQSITTAKFTERELDRIEASIEKWQFCREKYPELTEYAERYIVYDCLICLSKMQRYDHKYDGVILNNIRSHIKGYMRKGRSWKGKGLAAMAFLAPSISVWILGKINYVR